MGSTTTRASYAFAVSAAAVSAAAVSSPAWESYAAVATKCIAPVARTGTGTASVPRPAGGKMLLASKKPVDKTTTPKPTDGNKHVVSKKPIVEKKQVAALNPILITNTPTAASPRSSTQCASYTSVARGLKPEENPALAQPSTSARTRHPQQQRQRLIPTIPVLPFAVRRAATTLNPRAPAFHSTQGINPQAPVFVPWRVPAIPTASTPTFISTPVHIPAPVLVPAPTHSTLRTQYTSLVSTRGCTRQSISTTWSTAATPPTRTSSVRYSLATQGEARRLLMALRRSRSEAIGTDDGWRVRVEVIEGTGSSVNVPVYE